MYGQVIILMFFVCLLARQCTTFKWKGIISMFSVLQGSAETIIGWDGKMYHLLIACFLLNICAKNYQNPTTPAWVTAKNVGVFFIETQCITVLMSCHHILTHFCTQMYSANLVMHTAVEYHKLSVIQTCHYPDQFTINRHCTVINHHRYWGW